jgi:glycine cleavage system aminomethyltransferase T
MIFESTSMILDGAATLNYRRGGYSPYQYTSPKDELLAARETAWLGCYLSYMNRIELWGPDVAKFLTSICVNRDFSKLEIGGSRHVLMCNEKGQIVVNGIATKSKEDYFRTYCLTPLLPYYVSKTDMKVECKIVDEYFFQIDGPKSLEILEKACECDLHELKFGQNKIVKICGTEIFIHRLGMSGALAYEVHGAPEHAEIAYKAIKEAGQIYSIRQLGCRNYCSNHTPGGYPNQYIHFGIPIGKELSEFFSIPNMPLSGSAADDEQNYYVTPYDVGWGNLVNFDHEFPGKEALRKIAENQKRTVATLEWNLDDVAKVYIAEISGGIDAHEGIEGYREDIAEFRRLHADKVIVNGKMAGIASGRSIDYYHKKFLSLAFIEKEYAVEGKDVTVLWGKPGAEQIEIRARVARYPYFNEEYRNETFDVEKISHPKF